MNAIASCIVAYPAGRIVLHIIAVVVDREWAFHFAGILRELPNRRSIPVGEATELPVETIVL